MNGIVVSTSRRFAYCSVEGAKIIKGKVAQRDLAVTVGDTVDVIEEKGEYLITELKPRKNCLHRTYLKKSKEIAANLDRLYIVTAPQPLFNTNSTDRILSAAYHEGIECCLLVNKSDLGIADTQPIIDIYLDIGLQVIVLSAKDGSGLNELEIELNNPEIDTIALAGVSGVGKSTLLNQLVPDANRRTSEVSDKTGQGKQTTSQSFGHLYNRDKSKPLLIIDLPGIQSFGISHLSKEQVRSSFPEFEARKNACEYADCFHLAEPNCAIKQAYEEDQIAFSRIESYCSMLDEIEAAREY